MCSRRRWICVSVGADGPLVNAARGPVVIHPSPLPLASQADRPPWYPVLAYRIDASAAVLHPPSIPTIAPLRSETAWPTEQLDELGHESLARARLPKDNAVSWLIPSGAKIFELKGIVGCFEVFSVGFRLSKIGPPERRYARYGSSGATECCANRGAS
jgi:hypothetical protein